MPPDEATTLGSVERTGRVVLVDECHLRGSTASELAGTIAEKNVRFAESAAGRVCRADVPTPFSAVLDAAITPDVDKICRRGQTRDGLNRTFTVAQRSGSMADASRA